MKRALLLLLTFLSVYPENLLCLANTPRLLVAPPSTAFRIDSNVVIQDIFKCSRIHFIGSFNEYYLNCDLHVPAIERVQYLEIVNVTIDGAHLAPYSGIHVELTFKLSMSLAHVSIRNSRVQASAIEISSANIVVDRHSTLNVTARGLKFGPGYNSWSSMGGSYGGMGGASLTEKNMNCDELPPNDFLRAVGDVSANMANFRGYGSGGGNDQSRGGGRIRLVAMDNVEIQGSLVAHGGDACWDCYDSAGAGGSIIVVASERIYGNGTVQANGGEPSSYSGDELTGSGGGGGGGGGRIVLDSKNGAELGPARVTAYGGGLTSGRNRGIEWCQLGADGTILIVQHSLRDDDDNSSRLDPSETVFGTLLVKGGRLAHTGPVKRIQIYGCTPIFEKTTRDAPFLPKSLVQVFVSGGATICASVIQLKDRIGAMNSSIAVDSGSELNILHREQLVRLSASQITIQGYVGPSSSQEDDLFDFALSGADISFSNALVMVHKLEVDARGALRIDKFSEIKFQALLNIQTDASTEINGILLSQEDSCKHSVGACADNIALISVESKQDVKFCPQFVEMGQVKVRIKANCTALIDMPFDAPFLKLLVVATNVSIHNVNSGPVVECNGIDLQANVSACPVLQESNINDQPYLISVFASEFTTLGNVSAGSIILCSSNMAIRGAISSSQLGCGPGLGPGKSKVLSEASGGAGHGGRGGNVFPGSTGGGASYDVSNSHVMLHTTSRMSQFSDEGWPTWPGSGAASGDVPNQVIGGSGGGMIYIGSVKVNVAKTASISARGGNGAMGGGGGSGGSVSLFVAELKGGGCIDLAGGSTTAPAAFSADNASGTSTLIWTSGDVADGAGKAGGGGGGGIIRISYLDTADNSSVGNGEAFIKEGGRISVDGGKSPRGENGGTGVMVGSNCHQGRGGVFCLPCPQGTHSPNRSSKCLPCDPGTYASHTGSEKCNACPIGRFNADFGKTECQPCPVGSFGPSVGLKKCKLCPPGSFTGLTGSNTCSLCPVGSIATFFGSSNCTICGIGKTTPNAGATVCTNCKEKPVHSEFNMPGNCSYACYKGRNGLDCLTPFERLVKPIGGPLGFVLLIFGVTGLIFGLWGFISHRSSSSELHRYAQYKAQRLRDELSLKTLTRTLTPRLTDQDLNSHVARLYFAGDNHLKSSWHLNPYFLPVNLRDIVEEGTYARFASTCNKLVKWDPTSWEAWLYRVLLVTIPPLSTLVMRRCQLYRVVKLAKYIGDFGGRFFRDRNFRVHGTQLKVGFSPDFSLVYIDVLISPSGSSSSVSVNEIHSATLQDTILVVSGSGSFFRPYHLDTNDIIVRAIPSRLQLLEHDFWIDFVATINQKLRVLPQPSSAVRRVREAAEVARDILSCVQAFNENHVKDGIAATFGTFSIGKAVAADSNESCFKPFSLENVDPMFASYPQDPFKLALRIFRVTTSSASSSVANEGQDRSDIPNLNSDDKDGVMVDTDPRSSDFRYSQIRMEALFVQPERPSQRNDADDSSENDSLISPMKSPNTSSIRHLMEFLSTNDSAMRWLTTLWQPVYPLFRLRNMPHRALPFRWLLPMTMVLLLLADSGVAFWIMVEYYCVQIRDPTAQDGGCSRTAQWSVLGLLPGAIVASPLLGLVFVIKKSIFCGKLFALWNASSIVNQLVAFTCGLVFLAYIHDEILFVAAAGVLIKYFEKEAALRCIAQYASERPLRGWRGFHTTRDWYDAAYTPLVHYES
ncbi:hypothetical protein PsorP6_017010 [Peronosclerospora sorghi]|uniref:Uncharacterized protein n=1 Tax=Peronosclerospora sorghi TaxID=230839 RepID=A0ACC0WGM2_9STRA|nr:hypothetical protein PsorP6_017010 [Peronosclerospora sorghi]